MTATITAQEIRHALLVRREIAIFDLRDEDMFARGHPLFAAQLPLHRIAVEAEARVPRKDATVVVYDDGEGLVAPAAEGLAALGYRDVRVLGGGLSGWRDAGYELFEDVNSYSQASGNRQCVADGALSKRLQAGFAARDGITAVHLARAGLTGASRAFEGKDGFFNLYQRGAYRRETVLDGLGEELLSTRISLKPYLLADLTDFAAKCVEPARSAAEHAHDQNRPLVADPREQAADMLALRGILMVS